MAMTNSEYARQAETAAREAREAQLPVFVFTVREPAPDGPSDMTRTAVQTIESFGWRLEHMTSRSGDDDFISIHTLLFRFSPTPA
jgi:hypothetical protein